jgi:2-C-methyl-D-erythritol 4-phosphate cytidylyltransferase/2-C-methyl-D-erythritol 2,4-cyclodiphosphate synthase
MSGPEDSRAGNGVGVAALLVAAGRGIRAGRSVPKQYAALGGQPVLRYSVQALLSHRSIDILQVVIGENDQPLYEEAVRGFDRVLAPTVGGATRQQSVRNGLEALAPLAPKRVLVHDGARPFPSRHLVSRLLDACDETHGAVPALAVSETLKKVSNGLVDATIPREGLAAAQTPQAFPFASLLAAHRAAAVAGRDDLTDDAAVVWLAGMPVRIVPGERSNIKLTDPEDFADAERWLAANTETVTAQGFDVHAFGPGDRVRLCGVEISHDRGLVGHSDADVGLHALTDALLGTIGSADIGSHFPPADPQWRGAASDRFLTHAAVLVGRAGGRIVHLDMTLVCERPRIAPYREAMRASIAAIAGVEVARVSVKATTSEGLGFTGRGEGVAAMAMATVALPVRR